MEQQKYRPDIDGLRALAVLGVLLFHLDFQAFGGGYVGVDIFFVISGFLITRLIRDEIASGTFGFGKFYIRRARRLLPALFFTFAFSFICAFALFSPQHMERFGGELLSALFSVSNFYFWQEAGYFDTLESFKPLLHTWSLSVEEQFYYFWPALLSLLLLKSRKAAAPAFIVAGSLLSLYFANEYVAVSKAAVFFLAPYRAFEFGLGALMVWLVQYQPRNKAMLEPLVPIGLALAIYPMLAYTKDTLFPGASALMPCLGAALLIYSGTAKYCGRILNNAVAVKVGLISYSLYLIHWPLIVFYQYYTLSPLDLKAKLALAGLSILMAMKMHTYIETPFRRPATVHKFSNYIFVRTCITCVLLIACFAGSVWTSHGWLWRFSKEMQPNFTTMQEEDKKRQQAIRAPKCHMNDKGMTYEQFIAGFESCNKLGKHAILIVGDSHAADLYVGFSKVLPERPIIQMTGAGCGATSCPEFMHYAVDYARRNNADIDAVFYTQRGKSFLVGSEINEAQIEQTKLFLQQFTNAGLKVYWFGPQIEHEPDMSALLARSKDIESFRKLALSKQNARLWDLDGALVQALKGSDIEYISKLEALCPDKACPVLDETGKLYYPDYGHWTVDAAQHFATELMRRAPLSAFTR